MCPPPHFGVEYVINPWMEGQIHATDQDAAMTQWSRLRDLLAEHARVTLMEPVSGLPDLVFTANAALIYQQTAVLSNFRCAERQPEAAHYGEWLISDGFRVVRLPAGVYFEGAGDALLDRTLPLLWAGCGFRSDEAAKPHLEAATGLEVQPLRLCDPRFYHLDTCFCPLEGGHLMYYPEAFDQPSQAAIESRVAPEKLLAVSEEDAVEFTCNAVNIGRRVILNHVGEGAKEWLAERGFDVVETKMYEFMKAGGAAKCLSLRLNEG
jgi:N-dimethylarginine dimethylaminohydrolase